jgi:deoxycytidine triphosphate deaminase
MDEERKKAEVDRLEQYACPENDPRKDAPRGVLLSDQIEHYVKTFKLIDPFRGENLKAAGYELTIGDEFVLGGTKQYLKADGEITIDPFNVVVIKTAETINLPRFLIARWNLRVRWAYEGLLWVGAAQVDPGWVGHLFCPIYNLSKKPVVVRAGDPIALMDFVTTSNFKQGESLTYKRPPKRILLDEYRAIELESALYTLAQNEIAEFKTRIDATKNLVETKMEDTKGIVENRMSAVQGRIDNFVSITFAVVGLLFAAVTLFFGQSEPHKWWDPSAFWICALAVVISMFAWVNSLGSVQWFRKRWQRVLFELFLFAFVLVAIIFSSIRVQSRVVELDREVQVLKDQLTETGQKTPAESKPAVRTPQH